VLSVEGSPNCQALANGRTLKMEKFSAAVLLTVCVLMLLRLMMGARRRRVFDARALLTLTRLGQLAQRAWRWRSDRRRASLAARIAIRRASAGTDVERDGNVYRPDSLRGPRKPH